MKLKPPKDKSVTMLKFSYLKHLMTVLPMLHMVYPCLVERQLNNLSRYKLTNY